MKNARFCEAGRERLIDKKNLFPGQAAGLLNSPF